MTNRRNPSNGRPIGARLHLTRSASAGYPAHAAAVTGVATALLIAGMITTAPPVYAQSPKAGAMPSASDDATDEAYRRKLESLVKAMKAARERHVLKPEQPQLIDGAIRGLLTALDPDAEIIPRTRASELSDPTTLGPLARFGLIVKRIAAPPRLASPGWRVVSVLDQSPSARAGLAPGDIITHIDDQPATELGRLELTLRGGPSQTRLALRCERPGAPSPIDVLLTVPDGASDTAENVAAASSVISLPGGLLLARLKRFTMDAVTRLTREIAAESTRPMAGTHGIVLDLRDIAATDYGAAIALADAFLDSGTITRLVNRNATHPAHPIDAQIGDIAKGVPIAILVNDGTAGAPEVLAAALQDNGRATLIGAPSAGQAVLRTLTPLGAGGERGLLYMATTRYASPKGRPLDKAGTKPDIEVKQAPRTPAQCRDVDRPSDHGDGQCSLRPPGDDEAIKVAVAHLASPPVAAAKP